MNVSPEMMFSRHDNAMKTVLAVIDQLGVLSRALQVVGSDKVATHLNRYRELLVDAEELSRSAFHASLDATHRAIEAGSNNMIHAALASSRLASDRQEILEVAVRLAVALLYRHQHEMGSFGGSTDYCNLFS